MIRPFTLLTFGIAAAAGLQMFQIKAGVTALEREIREVNRQVEAARSRAEVLRAEWALLNEPSRLLALARQHLALEPIRPQQFARLSELPQRTPPPLAFAGPVALFPEARAASPPAAAVERTFAALALREARQAPPPGAAATALPPAIAEPTAQPAAEPAHIAALPLPPPSPPALTPAVARQEAPAVLGVLRLASANGPPQRRIEAEPLPPPPGARSATRPATPPVAATPPATPPRVVSPPPAATPAARPAPPAAAVAAAPPTGGSVLGGAGSLPPPVPWSPGR
jgi:hypothetical protein